MEDFSKLTANELRTRLQEGGLPSGPITKTTRKIFEAKLAKYLKEKENVGNDQKLEEDAEINKGDGDGKTQEIKTKSKASSGIYFGICIPALEHDFTDSQAADHVYEDRSEVMKVLKKNPNARFKAFKSEGEAREFSKSSQEMPSSTSVPVILMAGPRYNALHIAAKHNVPSMCREILNTIENDRFLSLMFENDSPAAREERSNFILDLYLNTPDKGQCDTPLHFASKFGHIDVVEVLTQHHLCDRGVRNKYGNTPRNVICERCDESNLETLRQTSTRNIASIKVLKSKIDSLLDDYFYVPVFRSDGNTMQAVVGEPWSPTTGDAVVSIHNTAHASPISPSLQVKAFAGPMSPQKAYEFHCSWRSPNKSYKFKYQEIRRSDDEKGLERIGRNIAQSMSVPWSEYWEFLDKFADFSTDEGLQLLENYLKHRNCIKTSCSDELIGQFVSLSLDEKAESQSVTGNQKNISAYGDSGIAEESTGTISFKSENTEETKSLKEHEDNMQNLEDDKISIKPDCILNKEISLFPISLKSQENFFRRSQHHDEMLHRKYNAEKNERKKDLNTAAASDIPHQKRSNDQSNVQPNVQPNVSESCDNDFEQIEDCSIECQEPIPSIDISTPMVNRGQKFMFIQGCEPSKLDMNVYLALEHVHIPSSYPHIIGFKQLIEGYSMSDRKSWKTPIRVKQDLLSRQQNSILSPTIGKMTSDSLSPIFNKRTAAVSSALYLDIKGKLFEN
ncbi:ankyrin repeat and LEM domain-containing protein 2-like isoform X2 [Antedon mediterranea]|uniref:ankyrin repeat and LEM domain-containing protein 2-like isoform X2 n=1 Tax=Antedon mediterranea TaxID=105859 RepID=UPI003AF907EE